MGVKYDKPESSVELLYTSSRSFWVRVPDRWTGITTLTTICCNLGLKSPNLQATGLPNLQMLGRCFPFTPSRRIWVISWFQWVNLIGLYWLWQPKCWSNHLSGFLFFFFNGPPSSHLCNRWRHEIHASRTCEASGLTSFKFIHSNSNLMSSFTCQLATPPPPPPLFSPHLPTFCPPPPPDRHWVGRQGAHVPELRQPDGPHGRDGGHAEVEQRPQRYRHRGVGRPHQRHRRHLRHPDRRRRRVHPLPPAAQPAAASRRVERPYPPPLEPRGRDALPGGAAGLQQASTNTPRSVQVHWTAQVALCNPKDSRLSRDWKVHCVKCGLIYDFYIGERFIYCPLIHW